MFDSILEWASFIFYYASPVVVLVLSAFAWQRHPHLAFFMLAVSSALTVILTVGNAALARHQLTEAEKLAWWRCQCVISIIDGLLYPWSLYLIFRFIRERSKPGG